MDFLCPPSTDPSTATPRTSARAHRHARGRPGVTTRRAGLLALGLASSACIIGVDDPGSSGDTEDGVHVYCQNQNLALDGGDDIGGGGGGGGNYWWTMCQPQGSYDCNSDDVVCYNDGTYEVQYCKRYSNPDLVNSFPGVTICVGDDFPAPVDLQNDWVSGSYPSIETEIRDACTDRCLAQNVVNEAQWTNVQPELTPQCDPAAWTPITTGNWQPGYSPNCFVADSPNVDDPFGTFIDWSSAGGPPDPQTLPCSLTDDCADLFYPHVRAHVVSPGQGQVIEPETRSARALAVDDGSSMLAVDMSGAGPGVDDAESLQGFAEYSTVDCGAEVCPFYLANLVAYNSTDEWNLRVESSIGRMHKNLSDVQIDLLQSTLGVHHMELDKVAFAPGAIRLQVKLTVGSCRDCSTLGNGDRVVVVENVDTVFADYVDGSLFIDHDFPVQGGTASLSLGLVTVESAPVAQHDVGSTESCNHPEGLILDASRSFTTDPDGDLESEMWWVDGEPCMHGCVVPLGSHTVSLEAQDARGAVDRTADSTVNVAATPSCAQ